jgi:predicted nucleic acid-binding protein
MKTLLDTNILARLAQRSHPQHPVAEEAVIALQLQQQALYIAPQNLYEFWVVATRPIASVNGLGLSREQTMIEIDRAKSLFTLVMDTVAIYPAWEKIVSQQDVKGKAAHDARLVAAMLVHGIDQILTFNDKDFNRYSQIVVVTPQRTIAPK